MANLTIPDLIASYTNWSPVALSAALAVMAVLFLIEELGFASLIRRSAAKMVPGVTGFPTASFRLLRLAARFGLVLLLLYVIRKPEAPAFPLSLVYHAPLYLTVFLAGLGIANLLIGMIRPERRDESLALNADRSLTRISRRGLRVVCFLLAVSLLLWRVLALLPEGARLSRILVAFIILNGVSLIALLLLVEHRVFAAAEDLLSHGEQAGWAPALVHSMETPVRLLIVAVALQWLRTYCVGLTLVYSLTAQAVQLLLASAVIVGLYRGVDLAGTRLSKYSAQSTNSLDRNLVEMLRMLARILVISLAAFVAIRIITGKPLTTLLAGLGIGGLAVALAAQDTLKNFFGSIMVMSDKPFGIGDRVQVAGYDGTIEGIGFRSSRLRTLSGHLVTIPNTIMAASSIENVARRPHIRRLMNITVTYDTGPEKMEKALAIIRGILDNHEGMPPDLPPRVQFSEFNPDSLNILVIYWYAPADYWSFMAFGEKVNLAIMRAFRDEGIDFAFPSSTTYLEQPEGKALRLELKKSSASDQNPVSAD